MPKCNFFVRYKKLEVFAFYYKVKNIYLAKNFKAYAS
jgi:hypothetical protein